MDRKEKEEYGRGYCLLINLPSMLLLAWSVSGLVIALVDGLIIAKLC